MSEATPDLTPARLEELLAAATPGPWKCDLWYKTDDVETWDVVAQEVEVAECQWLSGDPHYTASAPANAALIALSPALAARVIELEAALRQLVMLITAAAIEEETSTHVAVSFADADAANILRAALRARAALETTNAE